jgi:hypothetical protein
MANLCRLFPSKQPRDHRVPPIAGSLAVRQGRRRLRGGAVVSGAPGRRAAHGRRPRRPRRFGTNRIKPRSLGQRSVTDPIDEPPLYGEELAGDSSRSSPATAGSVSGAPFCHGRT